MFDVTVSVGTGDTADNAQHDADIGFMTETDYLNLSGSHCHASGLWKFSAKQRFKDAASASLTWRLYNFIPDEAYWYVVRQSAPGSGGYVYTCYSLGTPTLPDNLDYLNLQVSHSGSGPASNYVMFDTDDCGDDEDIPYLILVDTSVEEKARIVWYLDVPAVSGVANGDLTGWRYQTGDAPPSTNRILGTVGHSRVFAWRWDGTVIDSRTGTLADCNRGASADGPCYSHDVFKSDDTDRTYVLAARESTTTETSTVWGSGPGNADCATATGKTGYFVDDGFQQFDAALSSVSDEQHLMADYGYDPTALPGHNAPTACESDYWNGSFNTTYNPFDWTHTNSIAASMVGGDEVLDISLRSWDQVIRVDPSTGVIWSLSPWGPYTDPTLSISGSLTGRRPFVGQHDVHPLDSGDLLMLDNQGDWSALGGEKTRAIQISLSDPSAPTSAVIEKSWSLVGATTGSPLSCLAQGSAEAVPGTSDANVLALCNDEYTIVETDDSDGIGSSPLLEIILDEGTFCTTGGPETRSAIGGWFRAFPVETVGEY
jgi:hypothetical protein